MTDSGQVARRVVVHGRVQGVFYRDTCRREAERLGVTGWIRNEPDGSVAAHLEGAPASVDALVAWCHDGSAAARVDRVEVVAAEPMGCTGFDAH